MKERCVQVICQPGILGAVNEWMMEAIKMFLQGHMKLSELAVDIVKVEEMEFVLYRVQRRYPGLKDLFLGCLLVREQLMHVRVQRKQKIIGTFRSAKYFSTPNILKSRSTGRATNFCTALLISSV